jgi:hypothetical protein
VTDDEMTDRDVVDAAAAGDARRKPGDQGAPPRALEPDDEAGAERSRENATGADNVEDPAPGDVHGVGVTATHAAPGTAEEAAPVQGVRTPSES